MYFFMWNSKVLFMRCSQSPCKFGLTARFLYNVKYSVTILPSPWSGDSSWIIHDTASCRVQMYNVSANFTYLMSSLMLDASVCHARSFFYSLLCPDKRDSHRAIRVKLSQRTAPPHRQKINLITITENYYRASMLVKKNKIIMMIIHHFPPHCKTNQTKNSFSFNLHMHIQ